MLKLSVQRQAPLVLVIRQERRQRKDFAQGEAGANGAAFSAQSHHTLVTSQYTHTQMIKYKKSKLNYAQYRNIYIYDRSAPAIVSVCVLLRPIHHSVLLEACDS